MPSSGTTRVCSGSSVCTIVHPGDAGRGVRPRQSSACPASERSLPSRPGPDTLADAPDDRQVVTGDGVDQQDDSRAHQRGRDQPRDEPGAARGSRCRKGGARRRARSSSAVAPGGGGGPIEASPARSSVAAISSASATALLGRSAASFASARSKTLSRASGSSGRRPLARGGGSLVWAKRMAASVRRG